MRIQCNFGFIFNIAYISNLPWGIFSSPRMGFRPVINWERFNNRLFEHFKVFMTRRILQAEGKDHSFIGVFRGISCSRFFRLSQRTVRVGRRGMHHRFQAQCQLDQRRRILLIATRSIQEDCRLFAQKQCTVRQSNLRFKIQLRHYEQTEFIFQFEDF